MADSQSKRALKLRQVADRLGATNLVTVHRLIKAGKLKAYRLNARNIIVQEADLERFWPIAKSKLRREKAAWDGPQAAISMQISGRAS